MHRIRDAQLRLFTVMCRCGTDSQEEDPLLFRSAVTGRGPLTKTWRVDVRPIMCAYKICKAEVWLCLLCVLSHTTAVFSYFFSIDFRPFVYVIVAVLPHLSCSDICLPLPAAQFQLSANLHMAQFAYFGAQRRVESFIHDVGLRKTMLRAHRQVRSPMEMLCLLPFSSPPFVHESFLQPLSTPAPVLNLARLGAGSTSGAT